MEGSDWKDTQTLGRLDVLENLDAHSRVLKGTVAPNGAAHTVSRTARWPRLTMSSTAFVRCHSKCGHYQNSLSANFVQATPMSAVTCLWICWIILGLSLLTSSARIGSSCSGCTMFAVAQMCVEELLGCICSRCVFIVGVAAEMVI